MEMSGAFTKFLSRQCGGNTWGLLYISKKGREIKRYHAAGENSSGFTNKQSLQGGDKQGSAGPEVKVPAIPWGLVGRGYQ